MEETKMNKTKWKKNYNRHENTKIYKLINPDSGFYYLGSTCGPLTQRPCRHKTLAKKNTETKVYKCFNKIGWYNVKIFWFRSCI